MDKKRYCKGCHADVTRTMYCYCGGFALTKDDTYTEEELDNLPKRKKWK